MPDSTKTTAGAEHPTEPRTITLRWDAQAKAPVCSPAFTEQDGEEPVPFIELEPVLDMLEAHWRLLESAPRLPNERCYESWRTLGDFLREHGRQL